MKRTNQWLHKNVFPTVVDSEKLLDRLRFGDKLSNTERQAVWVLLSDLVYATSKRHYKRAQVFGEQIKGRARQWYELPGEHSNTHVQQGYDTHTERILLLVEWLKKRTDKSVGWCLFSWKKRFAAFEELRHFRSLGIHIEVTDVQKRELQDAITISRLLRTIKKQEASISYKAVFETWKKQEEEAGRVVTKRRALNFLKRWHHYVALMSRTKYAKSFDETLSSSPQAFWN